MNFYRKMILLILTGAAFLSVGLSLYSVKLNSEPKQAASIEKVYVLRDYNGRLAVFKDGSSEPVKVFRILTENYGETDREMLENGITVVGEDGLRRIIEDYTG